MLQHHRGRQEADRETAVRIAVPGDAPRTFDLDDEEEVYEFMDAVYYMAPGDVATVTMLDEEEAE